MLARKFVKQWQEKNHASGACQRAKEGAQRGNIPVSAAEMSATHTPKTPDGKCQEDAFGIASRQKESERPTQQRQHAESCGMLTAAFIDREPRQSDTSSQRA